MASWLDIAKLGIDVAQPVAQYTAGYLQDRGRLQAQQEAQRQVALTPGLTPEQQFLSDQERANILAPAQQTEWQQQETMTPFQKFMANAALAGSVPGQIQQIAPGLLPGIKKYGGAPGRGLAGLFEPDTSYLDDFAQAERERFQREVLPQIQERYGETRGSAVANAQRAAEEDLNRRLMEMRVGAFEKGRTAQNLASDRLLNLGMQPQFQLTPGVKEQEMSPYQKALSVKDPNTGELVSLDKFAQTIAGGKDMKLGKQFSAAIEKASPEQAFYIKNVLEKYTDRKGIPNFVKTLKTPEQFEAYYKMTNNQDPVIKSIAQKAEKALSSDGRKSMEQLYKAVQSQDRRVIDKLARRYNVANPGAAWNPDWAMIKGVGIPLGIMASAPVASLAASGKLASGISSGLSMLGSIFGGAKKPTTMSDIKRQMVKNAVIAQALRK